MRFFSNLIIALSIFVSTSVLATPASDLTSIMGAIKTVSATFTQTIYDQRNRQIQQATGKMALSRPGKFRWEVFKPAAQIIIANGAKLWIYDPDLQQVSVRNLDQSAGNTPGLLLSSQDLALDKDYTVVELAGTRDELRWFKLTPKSKDSGFELVQLGFYNGTVRQMILQDNLGHTTKIHYNNVKTNIALADSLFNFKPPAGVDVLDDTKKH